MDRDALQDVEMGLLLRGVQQVYGHDFLGYAEASLRRRMQHWLASSPYDTFSQAQDAVLHDGEAFTSLLQGITVNVTEMFRDPGFFRALRDTVVPFLKTYPFVKIWHAGCATGEEAYSMAILLQEAGLSGRYRMYATDINEAVLGRAAAGQYPLKAMQAYTHNYHRSGGLASFADYYSADGEHGTMDPRLREHLVFGQHNLVTDTDLGEMHLVLCRNVMIYFKPALKERCLSLFDGCLLPGGFLCLGLKEALELRRVNSAYQRFAPQLSIYRKRYG
jgi:chemotaxis protein methyltransferase CheR